MNQKVWAALAVLILGVSLTAGLIALASYQAAAPQAAGGAEAGLPAERAAAYRDTLLRSLRHEPYLIAPREDVVQQEIQLQLGPDASPEAIRAAVDDYYREFYERNNKISRPNPLARLGRMKQLEMAEAARAQGIEVSTALTGTPEVLTVMLNFTGVETYTFGTPVLYAGACLTDTTVYSPSFSIQIDGPLFNEIPNPTTVGDNWLGWISPTSYTGGFSQQFYELLMFSTTGYTDTWRPDVANPWDGGMGFDFSGVTFRNYFAENSRGVYIPDGGVVEVNSPYAESFFGAEACSGGFNSYNGDIQRVASHTADLINMQYPGAISNTNPSFSWADWDVEDVFDYDNDGNFQEPDGYVDHFFLIEAGIGEHGGGGPIQEFAIWAHSSDVNPGDITEGPVGNKIGGYQVMTDTNHPLGGVWVLNYTISDEGSGLGVLVHEYGHDIGLPDNYGLDGSGPNPGLWDLMASGSWDGELASMRPAHMTIWDKAEDYLGWNDPVEIDWSTAPVGEENAQYFMIGQQSKPPSGTIDGLRINLPTLERPASVQPFGANMWWSDTGDDRNESIGQHFTPTVSEIVTVTANLATFIEEDFDYLFWEFSTDNGSSWTALPVYSGTMELTIYTNPNGGNPGNQPAIDYDITDWVTATATISSGQHGGADTWFRFRYFTDAGFQEEGIYLDNISIDGSDSGNIFFDDAEGGDLWTHFSEGVNTTKPWRIVDGQLMGDSYYMVEWRNAGEPAGAYGNSDTAAAFEKAGFDLGLNRTYWIAELTPQSDVVRDPFFMHTPGMVVWYGNGLYENNNISGPLFDDPSWGAKGRILLADANPDPYFVDDPGGPRSVGERRSAFDGSYSLVPRPDLPLTSDVNQTGSISTTLIPGDMPNPIFRDRVGVAPGISGSAFIDFDAGVVLPTVDQVPYWAYWDVFGDLGNPGLNAFGINLEVVDQAPDGTWGMVKFWVDDNTVFADTHVETHSMMGSQTISYTVELKDASGSRYSDSHQHIFSSAFVANLPDGTHLITNSVSLSGNGTIFVGPEALAAAGVTLEAGAQAIDSNTLVWVGELGGNRLGEPDAVIEYAVHLDPGCAAPQSTLYVAQEMITDTFRNGGAPFLWPPQDQYPVDTQEACSPLFYLPVIFGQPAP